MGVPLDVTEWMKGYVGFGATDCDAGFIQGFDEGTYFEHEVVIHMDDIDRFVSEPTHTARMDGSIFCERLGGRRAFQGGTFNMLVDDKNPLMKFMFYRMPFTDGSGAAHTLLGHKTIENAHALDLLNRIMTLSIRVFKGEVSGPDMTTPAMGPASYGGAMPVAMGVLHIQTLDALKSARSFTSPKAGLVETAEAIDKFGSFYLDKLWDVYGIGHKSQR